MQLKSHLDRKGKRINTQFKGTTPSVNDSDIKDLVRKYPLHDAKYLDSANIDDGEDSKLVKPQDFIFGIKEGLKKIGNASYNVSKTNIKLEDSDNEPKKSDEPVSSKILKKALEMITRNIDRLGRENTNFYNNMMVKMVKQDIRDEEILKIINLMKDIDNLEADQIEGVFYYR